MSAPNAAARAVVAHDDTLRILLAQLSLTFKSEPLSPTNRSTSVARPSCSVVVSLALPTFLSDSQGNDSDALLAVKSVDRLLGHVFADAWVRKTATGIHILLDVRPHCKCASQLVVSRWLLSRLDLVCKVWYCFLA